METAVVARQVLLRMEAKEAVEFSEAIRAAADEAILQDEAVCITIDVEDESENGD